MPLITHKTLAVMAVLTLAMIIRPAHAVVVYESDHEARMDDSTNQVQIIEGDKDLKPPLPPAPRSVPKLYMSVAAMPVFPTGSPVAAQPQELAGMIGSYNKALDPVLVDQISHAIHSYSDVYNLDPRLMTSVVAVESSFRPNAISSTGAMGLGQLKPGTARWLGVLDPFDPVQNLSGVAKYLRYLLDKYNGNTSLALAAYYKGQGTIDKQGVDDNAQYYVNKISRVFSRYF